MTQLDRLLQLLNDFGVGYDKTHVGSEILIACNEGRPRVEGYCRFYTVFVFSAEGEFDHMGAYE